MKNAVKKLCDVIEKIYNILAYVCGFMLIVLILLSIASVVCRWISHPIFWSDEAQRFLMIAISFIGAGVLSIRGEHLLVDMLDSFFPPKIRRYVYWLADIFVLVAMLLLLKPSIQMVLKNAIAKSPAMQISMAYVYASIPIGVILVIIAMIQVLLRKIVLSEDRKEDL